MGITYFDPETGDTYRFGPDQTPPPTWKKLKPIPPYPGTGNLGPGGCAYYEPGKEPRLFVDPETGESKWVQWPYIEIGENWKPVVSLSAPPPLTEDDQQYFDPETGDTCRFGSDQTPPPTWKKLKPIPPYPGTVNLGPGGCAYYEPGKEPRLFVDPETGESKWVQWPYIEIGENWKPVVSLSTPPPLTEDDQQYFDPETGDTYRFGSDQTPPPTWKKLKPIPPYPGTVNLGPGGCVFYEPGKEPRLFVDPETGESKWVQWPYIEIGENWKPVVSLSTPPPLTEDDQQYFDPETGDTYRFGSDQTPPPTWKKLKPIPPYPGTVNLGPGGCVFYEPGKEPRLFVDPETGESKWVQWPYIEIGENWKPVVSLSAPPPLTEDDQQYFDPETGDTYRFGSDQTPPPTWKKLKPIPPYPGTVHLGPGGCVFYEPGKEPRLFVDPETGESKWVQWPYIEVGEDWKLVFISNTYADPLLNRGALPDPGLEYEEDDSDSVGVLDALKSEVIPVTAPFLASANSIIEWSIWNPMFMLGQKNSQAFSIQTALRKMLAQYASLNYVPRKWTWRNLRSLQGYLRGLSGLRLEALAGGNLRPNFPAADALAGGKVIQVKSLTQQVPSRLTQTIKNAATRMLKLFRTNPGFYAGSTVQLRVIVPTGSPQNVIDHIYRAGYRYFGQNSGFRELGAELTEGRVSVGLPGKIGTVLKGLGVVGGVASAYQLKNDIEEGDVASGIGSAAGTATLLLEGGAYALGSTTLAASSAVTGSFAAGYAVGTVINDHVLSTETKSLIGETLNEFSNMSWGEIWDFYTGGE